jgi:hypothetical protein
VESITKCTQFTGDIPEQFIVSIYRFTMSRSFCCCSTINCWDGIIDILKGCAHASAQLQNDIDQFKILQKLQDILNSIIVQLKVIRFSRSLSKLSDIVNGVVVTPKLAPYDNITYSRVKRIFS